MTPLAVGTRRGVVIMRKPWTPDRRCGSYAGYRRHYDRGEVICPVCQDAQRVYDRARRAKTVAERAALDLPGTFGRYACTSRMHLFAPLLGTLGADICAECFGFIDDPRHASLES